MTARGGAHEIGVLVEQGDRQREIGSGAPFVLHVEEHGGAGAHLQRIHRHVGGEADPVVDDVDPLPRQGDVAPLVLDVEDDAGAGPHLERVGAAAREPVEPVVRHADPVLCDIDVRGSILHEAGPQRVRCGGRI